MVNVDIAGEAQKVGNALTSLRVDQMIVSLAKGIAQGQFLLDQQGIDITKMMGVPGTVSIGGEKLSMLEAGFIPSFYHFVDTILEVKVEVKMRQEESMDSRLKEETSLSSDLSVGAGWGWGEASLTASAAYTKTVDTAHSQKFSQDLSGQSLIRTKLVPVPAPEGLVNRINALVEEAREAARVGGTPSGQLTEGQAEDLVGAIIGGKPLATVPTGS